MFHVSEVRNQFLLASLVTGKIYILSVPSDHAVVVMSCSLGPILNASCFETLSQRGHNSAAAKFADLFSDRSLLLHCCFARFIIVKWNNNVERHNKTGRRKKHR